MPKLRKTLVLLCAAPMTQSLRIAVADDEPDMRDYFRACLKRLGHQAVVVATNGRDLVEQCRALQPDLVITDIKMPDMDGIDAATRIYRERPVPVILVSAYHDPALVEHADTDHIQASLVKPIRQANLEHAIVLAMQRFEQHVPPMRRMNCPRFPHSRTGTACAEP
jgi:two-component system, response regulator PdtaR